MRKKLSTTKVDQEKTEPYWLRLWRRTSLERHLHTVSGGDVPVEDIGRVEEGQPVGGLHCKLHQLCRTQVSTAVLLQVPGEEEKGG